MLTIVPAQAQMRAVLLAPSSAIGFVHNGQRVLMLYSAFPYQKFGEQSGTVVSIAQVAVDPDQTKALLAGSPLLVLIAFFGLGAAQAGFNMSSQTMVLEFGAREDIAMRLGLSQTAQGLMNAVGPVIGGLIAIAAGYRPVFVISMVFEAIALGLLIFVVDEPRYRRRNV